MWERMSSNCKRLPATNGGGLLASVLAGLLLVATSAEAETRQILIRDDGLHPRVLRATLVDEVVFVNATGRLVHVEFLGSPNRHHVARVPGRISVVFHQEGPHRYVVHEESGDDRRVLRGVVEVEHVPGPRPALPTCGWLSVEGVCLAP